MASPLSPKSLLYAELLSNIRQISLAVSLASPCDSSTRVTVAADGLTVELTHHQEVRRLTLPERVSFGASALPIQKQGITTLSWRLPLQPSSAILHVGSSQQNAPLWSATDLESGSEVTCRECHAVIVASDTVEVWKDLPSENWAEMMEFWHCHKPNHHSHDHHDAGKADEKSLASRGYGSSSTIYAQKGVGFVDLTTLLFVDEDCRGLTVSFITRLPSLHSISTFLSFFLPLLVWFISCRPGATRVQSWP